MGWLKDLFSSREAPAPAAAKTQQSVKNVKDDLDWLNPQVQAQCRQRAQSPLGTEDERPALQLARLYRDYDRVCNHRNEQEKAQCEQLTATAAELGRAICASGGPKRMLLVAFRAEKHGARMRTMELWWDGIGGWMF
jgi:predicted component of type VI protein secretion system